MNRLRATAVNNESRELHSQLQSVLDYYNKTATGTQGMAEINWDEYESNIHTKDVVSKIRAKYADFMQSEFSVDGAIGKVGTRSEAMKSLDVAMHYNDALWWMHYYMHLDQLETMANIGDVTKLSLREVIELTPENAYSEFQQEIGNMSPQDLVENPILSRMCTQFSWGSRYQPPFVHSQDTVTTVIATLSKLGK